MVTAYRKLQRVSISMHRTAQRSIFRIKISARLNANEPPFKHTHAGPTHPKITLPYNKLLTAIAYTMAILTLRLNSPNNRLFTLTLLNATYAFSIRHSNIRSGLLFYLLMIKPKYLNSQTFLSSIFPHLIMQSIFIYITLVLLALILSSLSSQKFKKPFKALYKATSDEPSNTASSANARKKS